MVAPNLSHELIMGTDVMERDEFIIDYKNNVVNIGEKTIPTHGRDNDTDVELRRKV